MATMLPLPPIQLPQRAPRPIQALEPIVPFISTNAQTKPIMMVRVALKKPMSIFGPSLRTLRMLQRSSIAKIIA